MSNHKYPKKPFPWTCTNCWQIQGARVKANLTQAQLAAALEITEAAVERPERGGQIQTRSLDKLMRLFFCLPQVREILTTQQISSLPYSMSPQA
ncbi:MAG TPA: helix-turn-helix domain-containing protein [Gemmataceae bacterium]|nr:helix-turn-helix domain-containing protein [Gemmataceae bacterium]